VVHEPASSQFVLLVDGSRTQACLQYELRQIGDRTAMDMQHTFTPPALRGQGIAAIITSAAFDHARANGLLVVPSCSYISDTFLPKHNQYADLVTH